MISKTNSPPIILQPSPDVLKTQIEMLDARIKEKGCPNKQPAVNIGSRHKEQQ